LELAALVDRLTGRDGRPGVGAGEARWVLSNPLTAGVWEVLPEANRLMVVRALGILLARRVGVALTPGDAGVGRGEGDDLSGRARVAGGFGEGDCGAS